VFVDDATYREAPGATTTRGVVSFASPTLTWTGDLATGESAIITYTVRVDDPALGGKSIINEVSSDELGSTCPTGVPKPSCTSLVTVLVPALGIAVTANGATTTVPGAIVGYTVTIRNTGQTNYASTTSVTTSLAGVVDDATYNTTPRPLAAPSRSTARSLPGPVASSSGRP